MDSESPLNNLLNELPKHGNRNRGKALRIGEKHKGYISQYP